MWISDILYTSRVANILMLHTHRLWQLAYFKRDIKEASTYKSAGGEAGGEKLSSSFCLGGEFAPRL